MLVLPAVMMMPLRLHFFISLRMRYCSLLCGLIFDYYAALLVLICGMKVIIHADSEEVMNDGSRVGVIISNHPTRLDGMVCWLYGLCTGQNARTRVVLKDALRKAPLCGWGVQQALFVFLARNKALGACACRNPQSLLFGTSFRLYHVFSTA
jgi:lysocardiolipin and lysophospholipid acyltransferase